MIKPRGAWRAGRAYALTGAVAVLWLAGGAWASARTLEELPDAPQAQAAAPASSPCQIRHSGSAAAVASSAVSGAASVVVSEPKEEGAAKAPGPLRRAADVLCPPLMPFVNWYARFLDGPQAAHMTPKQKAWLAVRNVGDPFNALTILGSSAIAVAADSHSPYGPGMPGFGRDVGASYAQDMTGEFFGTFLIPSIVHQDPHYHRLPKASLKKRIAHCLYQVVWTQGDDGKGMVNYANVVGYAIEDEIANLYVPGRETDLPASAERYGTGFATAPIDNFITEFLPDIARRIHTRAVFVQRIIDQVANTRNSTT